MTLFHSSNEEFDKFDEDRIKGGVAALGHGAYFSTSPQMTYGKNLTEWYAKSVKPYFDGKQALTDEEIEKLLEAFRWKSDVSKENGRKAL